MSVVRCACCHPCALPAQNLPDLARIFPLQLSSLSTRAQAASFGKAFLDESNPEQFLSMCRTLRVLNAVRHPDVGMPLTCAQYVNSVALLSRLLLHGVACGLSFLQLRSLELGIAVQ